MRRRLSAAARWSAGGSAKWAGRAPPSLPEAAGRPRLLATFPSHPAMSTIVVVARSALCSVKWGVMRAGSRGPIRWQVCCGRLLARI